MEKKEYAKPTLEVAVFETEDIITTSGAAPRTLTGADVTGQSTTWLGSWFGN